MHATQDRLRRPQLVIASNRSSANPKWMGEGDKEMGPTSCGSEKRMATQRQDHVTADVEPTKPETENSEQLHPLGAAKISCKLTTANFNEQLREIDAAITAVTPNLTISPLTEAISNFADNTTKKVDFINSNKEGIEDEMAMGLNGGLTHVLGLRNTDLELEPTYSHNNNMGQDLSSAHNLFSIGSYP